MILLIDLDNVAANLLKKWLAVYNRLYSDSLTPEQIIDWNLHTQVKCSSADFYKIIAEPGFFSDLEVMSDAINVIERLHNLGHQIYFLTATPYSNPTGGYDKCNWIQRHFPFLEKDARSRIIQAHHKHMVIGDLLFDDSPANLQSFPGIKVAMDYNFNKNAIVDYRVSNWLAFEKCVKTIEEIKKMKKK